METSQPVSAPLGVPQPKPTRRVQLPDWMNSILRNRKASVGIIILTFFVLVSLFAGQLTSINPTRRVGRPHEAPSAEHILGTTRDGKDVFSQVVYGGRTTLFVGFLTGTIIIAISIVMGLTAGYMGGWVDEFLSMLTNVFLILPGIPLVIVVAGWLDRPGPATVMIVLGAISWAWGARVLRSQTLTLRNSEFVAAARVVGEPTWRIILFEILPNMVSLVVSSWIGAVQYATLALVTLEFIGLGDVNIVTWGTILFWAQNNQALLTGAWWTFIPPGICIAAIGLSLTLINYGIDEITNPRLQRS
ncbi:MAG: ABC transporter permease [Chloroflexi bacterium]|nr:ABC transporter permease [Chloroflexota bacterium]